MATTTREPMTFNGIDGSTGDPLLPPVTPADIARLARGEPLEREPTELTDLTAHARRAKTRSFRVAFGVDPRKLEDTGWGVIFPRLRSGALDGEDPAAHARRQAAIREALAPLIEHRRAQASAVDARRFRALTYDIALPPGETRLRTESKHAFFGRQDPPVDGNAAVDPDRFPYYLLIVGSPREIPYRFQYQLDVQYAVGRLHFDTVDDYARYAASVVAAETGGLSLGRRMALWGPKTPGDRATELSSAHLLRPLSRWLAQDVFADPRFVEAHGGWQLDSDDVGAGTRARLDALLGGERTPALLLTASHGLYYPQHHPWHRSHTGALLCQDWTPGAPPREEHLYAADHLPADARLAGLVAFHFACFGAGLPAHDGFELYAKGAPHAEGGARRLAAEPFVSRLPQRMLAHPGGGALAVISHVDRAWGSSFYLHGRHAEAEQLSVFRSTLRALLEGYPVGCAMDYFGERYAATASDLAAVISERREDGYSDRYDDDLWMADRWLESNDARNYAVIGDPAVRLCAGDGGGPRRLDLSRVATVRAPAPDPQPEPEPQRADPQPTRPADMPPAFGLFGWGDKDDDADPEADRGPGLWARFTQTLHGLADNLATLDVCTYTAAEVETGKRSIDEVGDLRAWTRMSLDGDTHTCVPLTRGKVDTGLWAVHEAMVARAQAHRTEMLKTLIGAIPGLWKPEK